MNTKKTYLDSIGNKCSIYEMVEREPEWSANRILWQQAEIDKYRRIAMLIHDRWLAGLDFDINLSANLTEYLLNEMTMILGLENISSIDDAIDGLKTYLINETRNFLHEILDAHIENFIGIIMDCLDSIVDGEAMIDKITTFFTKRINILRAEFILTIWEVRG